MRKAFLALAIGLGILCSNRAVRADDVSAMMAQADAAYARRGEDLTQDKIAMLTYEKAAGVDPSHAVEAYWKAARAAWWLGEHDAARADRLEDYQKGMDDARKAIVLNPDSVEAHFWLGGNEGSYGDTKGVMKSLGMVKPIRHEMAEVIRINDRYNNGSAYQILGVVDYKVPGFIGGSKTRAKEELQKALVMGPNDPFHHYYMAEYWKITGDKEKLKAELNILRTLQPSPDLLPETRMLQERADQELK